MLINLFSDGLSAEALINAVFFIIVFLITITVHECAHGYIAYRMGDPTAKMMGRLTLNPVKHMDIVGTLMILFIGFGWAKPVPIDTRYFKNPKAGMALSALAGPVSNLLMAMLGVIIYRTIYTSVFSTGGANPALYNANPALYFSIVVSAWSFFNLFAMLNIYFAVFNLLPIPPLDGSRIVTYFLPPHLAHRYNYIERYGFIILILLLNLGRINRNLSFIWILQTISGWILSVINFILNPVFALFGG
ncbi:MAG: site-2 protease family protein [Oscillospiraceae bacterium]|nr:site-2 protease family protein [Oscillospiraceae bacterium]